MALIALFGQDPARFGILKAGASLGNAGSAQLHLCSPPVLQRLDGPVQPANVHVDEVGLPSKSPSTSARHRSRTTTPRHSPSS